VRPRDGHAELLVEADAGRKAMTKPADVLVLAALAAAAAAGDEPAKDARTKCEIVADAEKQFDRADANADGRLVGEEIVKGWLEKYVLDGDGKIARAEFVEVSTRPPKLRHPTPMRDAFWRAKQDMAGFDKNKDGSIQKDEYP